MNAPDQKSNHKDVLSELTGAYERYLRGEKRASVYTSRNYLASVDRFAAWLRAGGHAIASPDDLGRLEPRDIRAFLAARRDDGAAPPTIKLELSALKSFFRFLGKRYGVDNDAISVLRGPKPQQRLPRPVAEEDARRLIAAAATRPGEPWVAARNVALFTLLYGAGLRISEALSLKRRDYPFAEELRIAGKGGKERLAPLIPAVGEAVGAYLDACPHVADASGPLFFSVRGKPLSARVVQRDMKAHVRALGLDESATPHALRHAFATQLLAYGGDLRAVQELLGHASIAATQRYTKIEAAQLFDVYAKAHPRAG